MCVIASAFIRLRIATTGPAGVALLQPLGQEFVQIVIGIVSGLIAFALAGDRTAGQFCIAHDERAFSCAPLCPVAGIIGPSPEQVPVVLVRKRVSTGLYARTRPVRNKPRAEELEQYLAQMPEDVSAALRRGSGVTFKRVVAKRLYHMFIRIMRRITRRTPSRDVINPTHARERGAGETARGYRVFYKSSRTCSHPRC